MQYSDNIEIMMSSETEEVIKELFESLLKRYQKGLEESMDGSHFIFDGVNALYYDLNTVNLSRGKSYIDSPKSLKNKKTTINPKNDDDNCFQYALTVALIHEQIKSHPERILNFKPFTDQYNWKEIDFPAGSNSWKKFESNNESIAHYNANEIRHVYKSKYTLKRENQIILLMISDGEKWCYLAVKSLSALLRGISGNNNGYFYCLNCFRSYTTENKLKKHKNMCENHHYCYVEMSKEHNKTLKYNHGERSIRAPFAIYADLECLLEKMSTFHNDPEKSSTTKVNKHTPSGYSLFTHCSFDTTKNKLDYYRGKNCMEKFCKDLKEHATKIINYEKNDTIADKKNVIYAKKDLVLIITIK